MKAQDESILNQQIFSALNLNGFNIGRHVLRDKTNQIVRESWITGFWMAHIFPSFDSRAALAVVYEKERTRGVFSFPDSNLQLKENFSTTCTEFPIDWSDPVKTVLQEFNLFDQSGSLSLDGVSYNFQLDTRAGKVIIEFSNPQTSSFIALEQSIFQVAQEIVKSSNSQSENKFLSIWQNYLKR